MRERGKRSDPCFPTPEQLEGDKVAVTATALRRSIDDSITELTRRPLTVTIFQEQSRKAVTSFVERPEWAISGAT